MAIGRSGNIWCMAADTSSPRRPAAHRLAQRVEGLASLDGPAEAVAGAFRGAVKPGRVKDVLSGSWLGHALHPLLTDVPIGAWTSATLLDVLGRDDDRSAAKRLVAVGIASAVPTAVSGMSDWSDTTLADPASRRVGAVHAVANVMALGLYAASWGARRSGDHGRGVRLGLAGAAALGAGGFLGGHLSYARGVGVDQTIFEAPVEEWADVAADAELAEGELQAGRAGGEDVVVARVGGELFALADRCSHRCGPLHEGKLLDGCVECPWHASRFRLSDGSVERGPATFPQPAYETRVRDGRVEVRSSSHR